MDIKEKKEPLTENTVIGSRKILAAEFRRFFKKTLGEDYEIYPIVMDVIKMSSNYRGATLKDIIEECFNQSGHKNFDEILSENRFKNISESDKSFIIAFDKVMKEMGYDSDGKIGSEITYKKTGGKSKATFARVYMRGDHIVLRLYFKDIDNHRAYIENAPEHIKHGFVIENLPQRVLDTFALKDGDCIVCSKVCEFAERYTSDGHECVKCSNPSKDERCISCSNTCKGTKKYTIDGRQYAKCPHYPGHFADPSVERLPDNGGIVSGVLSEEKIETY